jgi:LPXTG-motif cell wall-anchored protein
VTLDQWVPVSSPGGRTENPATSHEGWIFFFCDLTRISPRWGAPHISMLCLKSLWDTFTVKTSKIFASAIRHVSVLLVIPASARRVFQLSTNSRSSAFSKKTLTGLFVASLAFGSFVTPANAAPSTREVCASNVSIGDVVSDRSALADSGMRPPVNPGENYRLPSGLDDPVPSGLACTSTWSVQQPQVKDGFFEFASLERRDSYLDSEGFLHVNFFDVSPGALGLMVKVINSATAEGFKASNNADILGYSRPNYPSGNQPSSGTYSASWTYGPFDQATRAQLDSGALVVALFYMGMTNTGPSADSLASIKVKVWTSPVVRFNANGGSGTMSYQVGTLSQALTLNSFARAGFNFSGWAENSDGTGTRYADGASFDFSSDKELFAQWTAVPAAPAATTAPATTTPATTTPATTTPAAILATTGANLEWLMVAGLLSAITGSGLIAFSRRKRIW